MSANEKFDFNGINHLALVCRDMQKTVDFYQGLLGMPLTKTINLPGGGGQFADVALGLFGGGLHRARASAHSHLSRTSGA